MAPGHVLGRRVRCSGCDESFVAEPDEELELAAVAPMARARSKTRSGHAVQVIDTQPKKKPSNWARVPSEDECIAMQAGSYRLGIRLLSMGVLTLLLPLVGLQYKVVLELRWVPWMFSAVLLPLGTLLCLAGRTETGGRVLVQVFRWTHLSIRILLFAILALLAVGLVVTLIALHDAHTYVSPIHPVHLNGINVTR